MTKGLFAKLYGLILVPTLAFIVTSLFFINAIYEEYSSNKTVYDSTPVLISSIDLLSALQVERGMSIAYINGIDKKAKLIKQRGYVDERITAYKKSIESANIEKFKGVSTDFSSALNYRDQILNQSANYSEVEMAYTSVINGLMEKIIVLKDYINDPYSSKILFNLAELDAAKEYGGLLKGYLTAALGQNQKLSEKKLSLLLDLKANFKAYSTSKTLSFSTDKSKKLHKSFKNLPEQKEIENIFMSVFTQKEGSMRADPLIFFDKMTVVLDGLNAVIISEIDYLKKVSMGNFESARSSMILVSSLFVFYLCLTIFFTLKIIASLVAQFRDSLHSLNNKTLSIKLLTEKLNRSSNQVKGSSVKQSEDIESTSSALTQISATLERNGRLLKNIEDEVRGTQSAVGDGQKQVNSVMQSIQEIAQANDALIAQINKNNEDFERVTEVINEISEKTMIIDDIVFQTKLLSFNASVEAARAGEHGKGFAVVAEEIGNLASMSGGAASEITDLVTSSKEMVANVRSEMVSRVNSSVEQNKTKIAQGTEEANHCSNNFKEIYSSVDKVNTFVQDFRVSADEQESAMREITDNIVQLDKATKSNLTSVEKNFEVSNKILDNTGVLQEVVDLMCVIIRGETITEERRRQKGGDDDEASNVVVLHEHESSEMAS